MTDHSLDVLTDAHGRWVPVGGILRWRGEHLAPTGCGSVSGYRYHRSQGEQPCRSCVEAHSAANLRRYQAQLRRERKVA